MHWRKGAFLRFAFLFALIVLLFAGGMAILALLFTSVFGGDQQTLLLVWVSGCGLALALPMTAIALGIRAFRSVAVPLANIMNAADAVAEGDMSTRVPERGSPEFVRLAQSFNRMVGQLDRVDQQRRNLTADVAHELRTPLHIIQGNLEGILDGVYQPTADHIEATLEETRQLARLVDDLRTLSLAESGQLTLRREAVDVTDLLSDVATSFSGQAEAAEVELQVLGQAENQNNPLAPVSFGEASVSTAATQPVARLTILGDAGRLDQVLSNLVANAIRHTPPAGCVTLAAKQVENSIQITVSDTGEGIAAADLPFVFDRFWKGDRSRTHGSGSGSGLGLSIASQLVKAQGGQIGVTSEVGKGTVFTIELPSVKS